MTINMKRLKKTYEANKKLNDEMVKGFNDSFLDLGSKGFKERIEDSFSGMGNAIYQSMVSGINESITSTLTGAAPKSMAQQIQDAIFAGGDDVESSIVAGFANAAGGLDNAVDLWSNKLINAVQGKSTNANLSDIANLYGTGIKNVKEEIIGNKTSSNVYFREKADAKSKSLLGEKTIPKLTSLEVLSYTDDKKWAKVKYNGKEGFINVDAAGLKAIKTYSVIPASG